MFALAIVLQLVAVSAPLVLSPASATFPRDHFTASAAPLTPTVARPVAQPGGSTSPLGANRDVLTILLLGIDQRPDEAAKHIPSRTDTMILVVIDNGSKRAALVSIPRDLV